MRSIGGRKLSVSINPIICKYKDIVIMTCDIIYNEGKNTTMANVEEFIKRNTMLDKYADFIDALEGDIFGFIINNTIAYFKDVVRSVLVRNYGRNNLFDYPNFSITFTNYPHIHINITDGYQQLEITINCEPSIIFTLNNKTFEYHVCSESDEVENTKLSTYLIGKPVKSARF